MRKAMTCSTAENSTKEKKIRDRQASLAKECSEEKSEKPRVSDPEQIAIICPAASCCESEIHHEDARCPVKPKETCQIKPDPPPPRYPHWTENPPPYCNTCEKKEPIIVKSSPIMFTPKKGPWRSTLFLHKSCKYPSKKKKKIDKRSTTIVKADCAMFSQKNALHRTISEDKHADYLMFPISTSKFTDQVQSNIQKQTMYRYCVEKSEKEKMKISDRNLGVLKDRCMFETTQTDTSDSLKKQLQVSYPLKSSLPHSHKMKLAQEGLTKMGKEAQLSNGWEQQNYKIRLKIFREKDEQLNPSPPRIGEVRQPYGKVARSPFEDQKKCESDMDQEEICLQLRYPCIYPPKWPVVENKNYMVKMDEIKREIRSKALQAQAKKCAREKRQC